METRRQVAEEVDRIKRLLAVERVEKERRDKDLDVRPAPPRPAPVPPLLPALRPPRRRRQMVEHRATEAQSRAPQSWAESCRRATRCTRRADAMPGRVAVRPRHARLQVERGADVSAYA